MLYRTSDLIGCAIEATDGAIGHADDFLFDDAAWMLRWLVVDTGTWLPGRKILLAPQVLGRPDLALRRLPVGLTREKIEGSPDLATHPPIARHYEAELAAHYLWSPHWIGKKLGDRIAALPGRFRPSESQSREPGPEIRHQTAGAKPGLAEETRHRRSVKEVVGYHIHATDGEIGHCEDFLAEEGSWAIRYMVVDTRNWWPGKKVVLLPCWITGIDWLGTRIAVSLTRAQVKSAPEFDPAIGIDRPYEERLHGHYGVEGYWEQ
jgi:hypothetical protein